MARFMILLTGLAVSALSLPLANETTDLSKFKGRLPFPYYSKEDWGGRPARDYTRLDWPVPLVTIHHTYIPAACFNAEDCKSAMRGMQAYHQDGQGWSDIGYNFAIGSDGAVYEGRGWTAVGAHAVGVNARSIGIVFIGDYVYGTWTNWHREGMHKRSLIDYVLDIDGTWTNWHREGMHKRSLIDYVLDIADLPPHKSVRAAKDLIAIGVRLGVISPSYNIIGHRQVTATECPGQSLFTDMSTWDRFLPDFDVNA